MSTIVHVALQELPKEIVSLINEEGYLEIFTRDVQKKFDTCFKIIVDNVNKSASDPQKFVDLSQTMVQKLSYADITKVASFLSTGASIANLCGMAAGFEMVLSELNKISEKLDIIETKLANVITIEESNIIKNYKDAINRYNNMIDQIQSGKKYDQNSYEKLISQMYLTLDQIHTLFMKDALCDKNSFFEAMFALAPLLGKTITLYDKQYYFENIVTGKTNRFNQNAQNWIGVIKKIASEQSLEKFHEYFFFEKDLGERDCYDLLKVISKQIESFSIDFENNRKFMYALKSEQELKMISECQTKLAMNAIKEEFDKIKVKDEVSKKVLISAYNNTYAQLNLAA